MTADDADDNQVSAVDGTGAPLKDQDLRRISLVRPELAQSKAGVRIGRVRIGGAVTHGGALLQPPDGDSSKLVREWKTLLVRENEAGIQGQPRFVHKR